MVGQGQTHGRDAIENEKLPRIGFLRQRRHEPDTRDVDMEMPLTLESELKTMLNNLPRVVLQPLLVSRA